MNQPIKLKQHKQQCQRIKPTKAIKTSNASEQRTKKKKWNQCKQPKFLRNQQ